MAITDWPVAQRPRERLITHGAASLTDAELLAIVLRVGVAGKSAVELGNDLLDRFKTLNGLFAATQKDFADMHGLGPAKFTMFKAMYELARRALAEQMAGGVELSSPYAVKRYLQFELGYKDSEAFAVLFIGAKNQLLGKEIMFNGGLNHTAVYPREIVKAALAHNAAAVIFAHNHPSGVASPSEADLSLTRVLQSALRLIEVKVLDHFILAGSTVYSFSEHGQI